MDNVGKEKRKQNPRETANIFSLLTFAYTGSLFRKGLKADLEEDDLYEVLQNLYSQKCGNRIEKQWTKKFKKKDKLAVFKLAWKQFGLVYIFMGLTDLTWTLTQSTAEPYAISNLVAYFKSDNTKYTKYDACWFAGVVIFLKVFRCFYMHNYIIWMQQFAIKIKTSFSSLIYRKALKLSPAAINDISLGNIVTLITRDVYMFQQSIWIINDMWIGTVQVLVICYLMYSKIGLISFVGIGFLTAALPLQVILGKCVAVSRLKVGEKSGERLQITQETLSAIRVIKMYTWEKFFNDKITEKRKKEINSMMKAFYLRVVIVLLGILCSRIAFYMLMVIYLWLGYSTDAELVFYIVSLFNELRGTMGYMIPSCLGRASELYASIIRISKVIEAEELEVHTEAQHTLKPKIELKNASVFITDSAVLKDVTISINSGLNIITGPVGSGKSSLLKVILRDYPLTEGTITSDGVMSYASQEPWLFPSSIKQNITFGEEFNRNKYEEVVRVCALTYDFNLLEKGDETIVADRGINLSKGQRARVNLARAIYKDAEIYLLDDSLSALDAHVQDHIFSKCIKKYLKNKIVLLVSHTPHFIAEAENIIMMTNGEINHVGKPSGISLEDIAKFAGRDDDLEKEVIGESLPNRIVEVEDEEGENVKLLETEQNGQQKIYFEIKRKGSVSLKTYNQYFRFGGGLCWFYVVVFVFIVAQAVDTYSDKLISLWVDYNQEVSSLERNKTTSHSTYEDAVNKKDFTMNLYSGTALIATVLCLLRSYALLDFCRRASINLHKKMSYTVINGVMAFFDSHFIGNVLNRFSQDMINIDEFLPSVLTETFTAACIVAGIIINISTVNWKFLIPTSAFFVVIVILRRIYMPTGRSLKRLEASTRSPMVGHVNASLEGLSTIRAFRAEEILRDEFDRHQDLYTSAHYTLICTSRAFGFLTDLFCAIFIGLVVASFVFFDKAATAGSVGLVLTQVSLLAGEVQWGIRQWSDLENNMTSVERLLEYMEIKPENKEGLTIKNWPPSGAVRYENVSLCYSNGEKVLRNINFNVNPKEKIGIVGRTGAGKSSILSTLFRLYDVEGKILIDGVDIKSVALEFLRRHISIIPQDPILFTGTVRTNLDPYGEFSDQQLWEVIDKVKLKNSISSLDQEINEKAIKFSAGQRQLLCLTRAILQQNKVVVLDEASANLDPETDVLLHDLVKENFASCTVFIIAHRLHTILESDKVLVLDRGEIEEFDDPASLLRNKDSSFYRMVEQAGLLNVLPTEE